MAKHKKKDKSDNVSIKSIKSINSKLTLIEFSGLPFYHLCSKSLPPFSYYLKHIVMFSYPVCLHIMLCFPEISHRKRE
jgi:hypothetical protein